MKKRSAFKVGVCIAWAAAAVSSATTANAWAMTWATANYANCSPLNFAYSFYDSGCQHQWNYQQQVALISNSCSSGGCGNSGYIYTDMVYASGRKIATRQGQCNNGYVYALGSCAC